MENRIRFTHPFNRFLSSLQFAVINILSLAAVLAVATILESMYGMRAAHVLVYGTWWFTGLLLSLSINVLYAALSRYPWKRHQTGFVVTHLGILILLAGSFITQRWGVDGSLPVVEGAADGDVILNDLRLTITEEEGGKTVRFPVRESAFAREGRLIDVDLGDARRLVVEKFLPRIHAPRGLKEDPTGLGPSGIFFELFNDRFQVAEWLQVKHPTEATPLNLGPAVVSLQLLPDEKSEANWRQGKSGVGSIENSPHGQVEISHRGRPVTIDVVRATGKWTAIGGSGLEAKVDRYLPYAIVQGGKLLSKSNDPVNPAVQVTVRDSAGVEEQHTLFARFPEFATRHGGEKANHFGLRLQMTHPKFLNVEGTQNGPRGRLEFARASDGKTLLYRIFRRRDFLSSGVVEAGKEVVTGWMDLRFRVVNWFPHAVEEEAPLYIEKLPPGESTFASAVRVHLEEGGQTGPAWWLMEGENRTIALGRRQVVVRYGKETEELPFKIHLDKFTVGKDPGTNKAATYASDVHVADRGVNAEKVRIQMNEPLHYRGFTFYQASYQMPESGPPISVFSVNRDPGRFVKYLGSLVMVFGIALMFYMNPHYWDKIFGATRRKK